MRKSRIRTLARAAMIAALYVALTLVSALLGLSSGAVQIRLSEMLCILPLFTNAAVPGVTVGCFIANLLTGGTVWDLTLGVAATFLGVIASLLFRKHPHLSPIPTIGSNGVLIPIVLMLAGYIPATLPMYLLTALTVCLGETISCGVLGNFLIQYLHKHPKTKRKLFGP